MVKNRLLLTLKYLWEETDSTHTVSCVDIMDYLVENGFKRPTRNSVYSDIAALKEIGIDIDVADAIPLEIVFWRQDKPEKQWHDRAFSHVYMNKLPHNFTNFHFQPEEVAGIVRINARDCLDVLLGKKTNASAVKITTDGTQNIDVTSSDFLTASNETGIIKYGSVLQSIIQMQ